MIASAQKWQWLVGEDEPICRKSDGHILVFIRECFMIVVCGQTVYISVLLGLNEIVWNRSCTIRTDVIPIIKRSKTTNILLFWRSTLSNYFWDILYSWVYWKRRYPYPLGIILRDRGTGHCHHANRFEVGPLKFQNFALKRVSRQRIAFSQQITENLRQIHVLYPNESIIQIGWL